MESTKTKVIHYIDIPPQDFKARGLFLDIYLPEGRLNFHMDTAGIDPLKPLRLSLAQPSKPSE